MEIFKEGILIETDYSLYALRCPICKKFSQIDQYEMYEHLETGELRCCECDTAICIDKRKVGVYYVKNGGVVI